MVEQLCNLNSNLNCVRKTSYERKHFLWILFIEYVFSIFLFKPHNLNNVRYIFFQHEIPHYNVKYNTKWMGFNIFKLLPFLTHFKALIRFTCILTHWIVLNIFFYTKIHLCSLHLQNRHNQIKKNHGLFAQCQRLFVQNRLCVSVTQPLQCYKAICISLLPCVTS